MPISRAFLPLQENKKHFLRVAPFFIKDAKNRRNRSNYFCRKARFKNITNAHINRFGPPQTVVNRLRVKYYPRGLLCNKEVAALQRSQRYAQFSKCPYFPVKIGLREFNT